MLICFSGPAVRVDVPNEGVDDEAVVLGGGAEEGTRGDVAFGVAELVGGGVDEVGPGDGLGGARFERIHIQDGSSFALKANERPDASGRGGWPDEARRLHVGGDSETLELVTF